MIVTNQVNILVNKFTKSFHLFGVNMGRKKIISDLQVINAKIRIESDKISVREMAKEIGVSHTALIKRMNEFKNKIGTDKLRAIHTLIYGYSTRESRVDLINKIVEELNKQRID